MSEVKRYYGEALEENDYGGFILASDYDALAAQRDEGLAREAELRSEFASLHKCLERQHREALESLQQRLAEARAVLDYLMERFEAEVCVCDNCGEETPLTDSDSAEYLREFLASPGCADGEKS